MSEKLIQEQHRATFDGICHIDEEGNDYWLSRELAA